MATMRTEHPVLAFVGAGRAGSALATAFAAAGLAVAAVSSRDPNDARALAAALGARPVPGAVEAAMAAEVTFLTVSDAEITRLAATIAASGAALSGRTVVHCSARLGLAPLRALPSSGAGIGVLHPLQALAGAASAPLLRGASFRVEAGTVRVGLELEGLVTALGGTVLDIAPEARDLYHAAAVLAGNAPLALLETATRLLEDAGVDRDTARAALAALLHGAAVNAVRDGPAQALTGPVARGDWEAVEAHLAALAPHPRARDVYQVMAREMERLTGRAPATQKRPRLHRVA